MFNSPATMNAQIVTCRPGKNKNKNKSIVMAVNHKIKEEALENGTLMKAMLPIGDECKVDSSLLPTKFFSTSTNYWRSLVIVGQNQVQRNGLLFQASSSCIKYYSYFDFKHVVLLS